MQGAVPHPAGSSLERVLGLEYGNQIRDGPEHVLHWNGSFGTRETDRRRGGSLVRSATRSMAGRAAMAGLVLFHFETAPIRRFLPGGATDHEDPGVVSLHVRRLLGRAFGK